MRRHAYRLVGAEPLGRVLANFFHKPGKDPPNAAVNAVDARTGKTVVMGLELTQARYDWRKRTVVYTARRLHGGADHVLPAQLARTSVFLDDYGYNTCSAATTSTSTGS